MTYEPKCELCGRPRGPRGCVCVYPFKCELCGMPMPDNRACSCRSRTMRERFNALPFDGRICPTKPQDVAATVERERNVYRGGPKEIRE